MKQILSPNLFFKGLALSVLLLAAIFAGSGRSDAVGLTCDQKYDICMQACYVPDGLACSTACMDEYNICLAG